MLCMLVSYVIFVVWFVLFVLISFVSSFFFFKQKTAYEMRISDWSSDVCSSDLYVKKIFKEDASESYFLRCKGSSEIYLYYGKALMTRPDCIDRKSVV